MKAKEEVSKLKKKNRPRINKHNLIFFFIYLQNSRIVCRVNYIIRWIQFLKFINLRTSERKFCSSSKFLPLNIEGEGKGYDGIFIKTHG